MRCCPTSCPWSRACASTRWRCAPSRRCSTSSPGVPTRWAACSPRAREAEAAVHACEHLGALDDAIGELQEAGVRVKDAERGLLDFPSERDGELVELCWLYGEHAVTHWHRIGEGYAQRRRGLVGQRLRDLLVPAVARGVVGADAVDMQFAQSRDLGRAIDRPDPDLGAGRVQAVRRAAGSRARGGRRRPARRRPRGCPGRARRTTGAAAAGAPRGQMRRGIVRPARMPGSARWMPASIAQLPPVQVTRPVRPAARTSSISGRSMPLVLRSRLSWTREPAASASTSASGGASGASARS